MDAENTTTKRKGRPVNTLKRQAIELLLREGLRPADVQKATGAGLTVIYEVRRAIAA